MQLRKVKTRLLDIAYLEDGPVEHDPIILIHGWPDDALTWEHIAPGLVEAGYRVLCPYLRGFGESQFLDAATMRSGQLSALGSDLIEFADALGLKKFPVVGHDWGARAAYIAAALRPDRVTNCVALSVGWGTNDPNQTLSFAQARNYWYHWFMATPRGEAALRDTPKDFTKFLWSTWSPMWKFSEAEFEATAKSFENPDWYAITLSSYRNRWGWAPNDPQYAEMDAKLNPTPRIQVPTLVLHGDGDAVNAPATSEGREAMFSGLYRRRLVPGAGHFPQREKPTFVALAMLEWLQASR